MLRVPFYFIAALLVGCSSNADPAADGGPGETPDSSHDVGSGADDGEARADAQHTPDVARPVDADEDTSSIPDAGQGGEDIGQDAAFDMAMSCATDEECTFELANCDLADVERAPGGNWFDSYSVGDKCYCDTTFDHDIGDVVVDTPVGDKTVREVCEAIGPGPGRDGHPVYNDIQCGNGPANNAGDEDWCPGRVDQGRDGCCTAGPKWDFSDAQW